MAPVLPWVFWLPLSLVRELGFVAAALLFASRAGSAITAEIGLMKATRAAVGDGNDGS